MKALIPVKRLSPVLALFFLLCFSTILSAYEVHTTDSGVEIRWFMPSASFHVNETGGPPGTLTAFQQAMQTWSAVSNSVFSFAYGGTTISTEHGVDDGVNIVDFGPLDQGEIARSHSWYNTLTGYMRDSDIRFNTTYYSFYTDGSGLGYDIQTASLHELGHALGLKDLYGPDSGKVMFYQGFPGEIRRSLSQDDIDGVVHLYPLSSCTYSLSSSAQTFYSGGGPGTVTVAAGSTKCTWTATSNDSWIIVTSGASGAGDGTTSFSVSANAGIASRTGTITVAGKAVTVTQSGLQQRLLAVAKSGNGYGTVASSPSGIDCGNTCSQFFDPGASVALNVQAETGSAFAGWSGSCSGTGSCTVTMTADRSVTAAFNLQQGAEYSLNLASGWNFVSIPTNPVNPGMADVLKDVSPDVRVIWGYDNANKAWLKYALPPAADLSLPSLEQGKGYWIYMLNSRTLTVGTDQTAPQNIILHRGWNLVGYGGNDGLTLESALSDLNGNWTILWGWEKNQWSATTSYGLPLPQSILPFSTLKKGKAIWIKRGNWAQPVAWKMDLAPPAVTALDPSDNGRDVPADSLVSVTFDKNIDCSTISSANLYLSSGVNKVDGTVGCSENRATFMPAAALSYDTTYTVTVLAGIKDLKGNRLQSGHTTSFTTVPSPASFIRKAKIGDTFVYGMTMVVLGVQYIGDITVRYSGTVTNPYGIVCQVYDMTGTLTGGGKSSSTNTKLISYQDAQGNKYDCGDYNSKTGQYNFIQDRDNTPNGLAPGYKSPLRVGDVISPGIVYYQDQSWENCSGTIVGKEAITTPAGTFETYRMDGTCSKSDGDPYTGIDWVYPQIRYIKEYARYQSGIEGTMVLKSYTLAP